MVVGYDEDNGIGYEVGYGIGWWIVGVELLVMWWCFVWKWVVLVVDLV